MGMVVPPVKASKAPGGCSREASGGDCTPGAVWNVAEDLRRRGRVGQPSPSKYFGLCSPGLSLTREGRKIAENEHHFYPFQFHGTPSNLHTRCWMTSLVPSGPPRLTVGCGASVSFF